VRWSLRSTQADAAAGQEPRAWVLSAGLRVPAVPDAVPVPPFVPGLGDGALVAAARPVARAVCGGRADRDAV